MYAFTHRVPTIRGGSRIFFKRGCTRLLLYFNTNKPHSFFLQNTSCIRKPQVISGGKCAPPAPPLPLDPPLTMWLHIRYHVPPVNRRKCSPGHRSTFSCFTIVPATSSLKKVDLSAKYKRQVWTCPKSKKSGRGAHNPEQVAITLGLCLDVFTDQFIFRYILVHFFPRKWKLYSFYERIWNKTHQNWKLNVIKRSKIPFLGL